MKGKKKDTRTIASLPILPGTLILCACTLIGFLGISALMIASGMMDMPSFLAPLFQSDEEKNDTFPEAFLASLSGNAPDLTEPDDRLLEMTPEALREILLSTEPIDSYYQRVELTWTDGKGVFQSVQAYCIVSEGRVRAEIYPSGRLLKTLICDGGTCFIQEGNGSRCFVATDSDFSLESEIGIPLLSHLKEMLLEAEGGKYTLQVETVLNSPCIRATFTDPITKVRESFDILPDCGLVVAAFSRLPDKDFPYYQMTTTSLLTDLSGLDESTFVIPNS